MQGTFNGLFLKNIIAVKTTRPRASVRMEYFRLLVEPKVTMARLGAGLVCTPVRRGQVRVCLQDGKGNFMSPDVGERRVAGDGDHGNEGLREQHRS
jgi:hypothetical protein